MPIPYNGTNKGEKMKAILLLVIMYFLYPTSTYVVSTVTLPIPDKPSPGQLSVNQAIYKFNLQADFHIAYDPELEDMGMIIKLPFKKPVVK